MDYDFYLKFALLFFCILNIVDFLLTRAVLMFGGREFNPIVKWIYSRFGLYGFAAFKGSILVLLVSFYNYGVLDLFAVAYLDFSFFVILVLMYFDLKKTGVNILKPENN